MRATLDIDIDILRAARLLAEAERKPLGRVLSELVRKGLAASATVPTPAGEAAAGHPQSCRLAAEADRGGPATKRR